MVDLDPEEVCDILGSTLSQNNIADGSSLIDLGQSLAAALKRAEDALFSSTHRAPLAPGGYGAAGCGLALLQVRVYFIK